MGHGADSAGGPWALLIVGTHSSSQKRLARITALPHLRDPIVRGRSVDAARTEVSTITATRGEEALRRLAMDATHGLGLSDALDLSALRTPHASRRPMVLILAIDFPAMPSEVVDREVQDSSEGP